MRILHFRAKCLAGFFINVRDNSVFFKLQPLQDKEGKKCLFLIKSSQKAFEISASERKKKQEWIQGESFINCANSKALKSLNATYYLNSFCSF